MRECRRTSIVVIHNPSNIINVAPIPARAWTLWIAAKS